MASLSEEEENYVRMSLLLTGICPRAVRTFFDNKLPPACLEATMKNEYNKLFDLKKKRLINQSQWNLLFPRFPDIPDSKSFDVTLMISLLRHLTPMTPPLCGLSMLPSAMETTPASDLAMIKYYRSFLAHLNDGKLDTTCLTKAWTDITGAIGRLGGQKMTQDCDHLKTKPLDQTNQQIMMDITRSNDEIKGLTQSLRSPKHSHIDMLKSKNSLLEQHSRVMKSHEMLQEECAEVTKELEIMKTSQEDTVPLNIRARIKDTLEDWKDNDDTMFINTKAAQYVLKCIKENSCVTITASSGVGKTATLRHVALQMIDEGYDILIVRDPDDILRFNFPTAKTLFVVDDLCGKFSLDQHDIKCWKRKMKDVKVNLVKKQTKILAACRLQVYQDEKFDSLSVFKSCVCNMLSEKICLSKTEKKSIAQLYLNAKASEISDFYDFYDCFPLLCKLYHDNPELIITDFFKNPYSVFEAEIDNFFMKGYKAKYCALALCVMFNNKLREEVLTDEVNVETMNVIEDTCEACRLDRGTSRLVLQDELDSLIDTFIQKENNLYKTVHDKIFDFLTKIYGQKIIHCLIRNADSGLIKERFLLEIKDDMDQFITIIPQKYHHLYLQRMVDDWSKGKLQDVFSNINMKIPHFRQKFLFYLNTLDLSYQRQLANTYDDNDDSNELSYVHYDTAILHCCEIGDISLVQWCCNQGVNVNRYTYYGGLPILVAWKHGHINLVKMLLDNGADYNKCDNDGHSPVMKAFAHGHTELVTMFLNIGADYNKCDNDGQSPVMKACEHGHTEIVRMLLDMEVDCHKCDNDGQSPVMKACEHGHTDIVRMLLEKKADYNKCDWRGHSPIMKACEQGHNEVVRILLDKGADYNKCDWRGQSPVKKACEHGHITIVGMLLDKGANYNKCDIDRESPLMKACEYGHITIVRMLLEKGADFELENDCLSPVMKACEHGHIAILRMLLDKGANYKCDNGCLSPVMKASEHGHTEIVRMLLNKGVDYDKCDWRGQSPVIKACEHGHKKIVRML